MKKIERFLNHLYYTAYRMTSWLAFEPTRKQEEYERSIELAWVLHGLSYLYIIDTLLLIKAIVEYVSGYDIPSLIGKSIFMFFFIAIIILIDLLVFHYFVYRKKKYIKYCEEFDKESKSTKLMWSILIVLLYIFAIIILVLIFHLGQTYIPKPV